MPCEPVESLRADRPDAEADDPLSQDHVERVKFVLVDF